MLSIKNLIKKSAEQAAGLLAAMVCSKDAINRASAGFEVASEEERALITATLDGVVLPENLQVIAFGDHTGQDLLATLQICVSNAQRIIDSNADHVAELAELVDESEVDMAFDTDDFVEIDHPAVGSVIELTTRV